MGLFDKMFKQKESVPAEPEKKEPVRKKPVAWRVDVEQPDEWLIGDGSFAFHTKYWYGDVRVAGVGFRNFDYSKLKNDYLELVKEPGNEFDSLAIRVEQNGQHLGYVPANRLQKMIHEWDEADSHPQGALAIVRAKLVAVNEESQLLEMELKFTELIDKSQLELPEEDSDDWFDEEE